MSIDHIEEVKKNIDEIEHIEKFNPFHDARGRFSSSKGMASYSANPKTKAGAMAINRSTAAGYGAVMNVHRESKGENIRQNDNWIRSGQKPNASQLARAQANAPKTLAQARQNAHTNRVKGTMGATETATARHPKPTKPTVKQPQQAQAAQQNQQNQQAQTQQAKPQTKPAGKISDGYAKNAVNGTDMSNSNFRFKRNTSDMPIEQIIKAQKFDGLPTVTKDSAEFRSAAKNSDFFAKRGVGASDQATLNAYDNEMKNGTFYVKCSGGSVHGYGMYCASIHSNGGTNSAKNSAETTANAYARQGGPVKKIYTLTLDKSAKMGDENTLSQQMMKDTKFRQLCQGTKNAYDVGVYAAYKGYDGYYAGSGRSKTNAYYDDYTVILNRSKVILYEK